MGKTIKIAIPHRLDNDLKAKEECFIHYNFSSSFQLTDILMDMNNNVEADWYGIMGPNYYLNFNLVPDSLKENFRSREYFTSNCIKRFGLYQECLEKWLNYSSLLTGQDSTVRFSGSNGILHRNVEAYCVSMIGKERFLAMMQSIKAAGLDCEEEIASVLRSTAFPPTLAFLMDQKTFHSFFSYLKRSVDYYTSTYQKYHFDEVFQELLCRMALRVFREKIIRKKPEQIKRLPFVHFVKTEQFLEPMPVFNQNVVPIAVASSAAYIPCFSVLLQSIIDHSSPVLNYDINVLTRDVSNEQKKSLLRSIDGRENFSLRFIDPGPLIKVKDFSVGPYHALESYYKLFVPWVFSHYPKMIVLDCDMLARADIAELLNVDLKGNPIGAVFDYPFCEKMRQVRSAYNYVAYEVGLYDPFAYANSGTLLMDLDLIRSELIRSQCTEFCKRCHRRLEQDTLNKLYHNRITFIDGAWNVFVGDDSAKKINTPKLLHFSGNEKPWTRSGVPYEKEYWECAEKTEFHRQLIEEKLFYSTRKEKLIHQGKQLRYDIEEQFIKPSGGSLLPLAEMPLVIAKEKARRKWDEDYRDDYKIETAERIYRQYLLLQKYRVESLIPGTFAYENRKKILALKDIHKGKRAFFVGLGPSLRLEQLNQLNEEITFSVNDINRLYNDTNWRLKYYLYDQNLFLGKKLLYDEDMSNYVTGNGQVCFFPLDKTSPIIAKILPDSIFLPIVENWESYHYPSCSFRNFSKDISDVVYTGGTSMYVNMQIAVYMGIKDFFLIGTDGRYKPEKAHAYQENYQNNYAIKNEQKMSQSTLSLFYGFQAMKLAAAENDVRIINATHGGYVECFPRRNFDSLFAPSQSLCD